MFTLSSAHILLPRVVYIHLMHAARYDFELKGRENVILRIRS